MYFFLFRTKKKNENYMQLRSSVIVLFLFLLSFFLIVFIGNDLCLCFHGYRRNGLHRLYRILFDRVE